MPQPDDFSPRRKMVSSELSATVPDIFGSGNDIDVPSEFTLMKLSASGNLQFPGNWLLLENKEKQSSSISYRRKDSVSALVSIGLLPLDQRAEMLVKNLCINEARALQDFELSGLQAALSDTRRPNEYEISAGSTELLCDKIILVIQGYFSRTAMKEALIIFPDKKAYGCLSLKSIKPEFPIYFNHLRHALKTIEWQSV